MTTKIFTSLMHSSNSQDKAWLAEQHKIANRVVNDLCLKANSSLVLSPEMKKYAKFVMIKVKAEWDEFRNKHVKRSPEFDSI